MAGGSKKVEERAAILKWDKVWEKGLPDHISIAAIHSIQLMEITDVLVVNSNQHQSPPPVVSTNANCMHFLPTISSY